MKRRRALVTIGVAPVAGCLGGEAGESPPTTTVSAGSDFAERVIGCETQYVRNEIVTRDDETIDGRLRPEVVDTGSRWGGTYAKVETHFGTTRSSDDGPDEHLDHIVTAYYLASDGDVYRIEDGDADPHDGTSVDC